MTSKLSRKGCHDGTWGVSWRGTRGACSSPLGVAPASQVSLTMHVVASRFKIQVRSRGITDQCGRGIDAHLSQPMASTVAKVSVGSQAVSAERIP